MRRSVLVSLADDRRARKVTMIRRREGAAQAAHWSNLAWTLDGAGRRLDLSPQQHGLASWTGWTTIRMWVRLAAEPNSTGLWTAYDASYYPYISLAAFAPTATYANATYPTLVTWHRNTINCIYPSEQGILSDGIPWTGRWRSVVHSFQPSTWHSLNHLMWVDGVRLTGEYSPYSSSGSCGSSWSDYRGYLDSFVFAVWRRYCCTVYREMDFVQMSIVDAQGTDADAAAHYNGGVRVDPNTLPLGTRWGWRGDDSKDVGGGTVKAAEINGAGPDILFSGGTLGDLEAA